MSAKIMLSLFAGLDRAYGEYTINKKQDKTKKKIEGRAVTVVGNVTEELWRLHVDGKQGLGIVPIRDDGTCVFGAIDFDVYPVDFTKLEQNIKKLKLPLTICKTKSNGAHLYVFFKEPVQADLLRKTLAEWAIALQMPKDVEVFPKQSRLASEKDIGNWINMPYFGHSRPCFNNGKEVALKSFITLVRKRSITVAGLEIEPEGLSDFNGAPPCLKQIIIEGIGDGSRNVTLFNLGAYARMSDPDNWKTLVDHYNKTYCDPPVPTAEITTIIKQLDKKNYFYTCKHEPLASHCNKELCKTCKHGVGSNDEPSFQLGTLVKINTVPPIWIIDVNGVRIEMITDDLLKQDRFRKLCVEKINIFPPRIKGPSWEKMIRNRLESVEEQPAPKDTGPTGQLINLLRQFCIGPRTGNSMEEVLTGRTYTEDNKTYFNSADFIRFLDQQRVKGFDHRKVWGILTQIGGGSEVKKIKTMQLEVWYVPEFEHYDENLTVPKGDTEL